jgi:hypothetical protein
MIFSTGASHVMTIIASACSLFLREIHLFEAPPPQSHDTTQLKEEA